METIYFAFYYRVISFSKKHNFESEVYPILDFKYSLQKINKQFLDKIYGLILKTKGDWVDFDLNMFNKNYYLKITLVYHNELSTNDIKINTNVIDVCKEFIESTGGKKDVDDSSNNSDVLSDILEDEGFIINIAEEDGDYILNYNDINLIFKENNIQYSILNINDFQRECGASMGAQDLLYFIVSSSASGITWDLIKNIYKTRIKPNSDAIKLCIYDKFSFKRMRKTIAERIKKDEKNLVLCKMSKDDEKIFMVFCTTDKTIKIETDFSYNILNLSMKDKS